MIYRAVLEDSIKREIEGTDYQYGEQDKKILREMLTEVNQTLSTDFHYLAEIDAFNIVGSGSVFAKYISCFESESVRCFLIPQIVADKVENCSDLILKLYCHFKESSEYIAKQGQPAPAHIYVRYDNAFASLMPKHLKKELLGLATNPRDAVYLPFTVRMLASWKMPQLKDVLFSYLNDLNAGKITAESFGITEEEGYFPSFKYMRRELIFRVIQGLQYYPCEEAASAIRNYCGVSDKDICLAAQKSLKNINKKL